MSDTNRRRLTRRRLILAGAGAGAAGLAGCLAPGEPVTEESTERFPVESATAVAVDDRNGDVRVERGDGADVAVAVRKRTRFDRSLLDRVAVDATTDDGVLTVASTAESDAAASRVRVDLTVQVPASVSLARATTENGDVTAAGVPGDATLRTVNGTATAQDVAGHVTLRSTNGDVVARGVAGVAGAVTTNGDVDVHVPALRGDARLTSTNGDVSAGLAADLAVRIEARTANGHVDVRDLPLDDEQGTGSRVSGTRNGGGPTLTLQTVNGDVDLYAL
ncbi:MAG: DUF4097 domain-containing protein [Haloarculaceae archaeon]